METRVYWLALMQLISMQSRYLGSDDLYKQEALKIFDSLSEEIREELLFKYGLSRNDLKDMN